MAASGEDAVEKARRIRPDLVLMDIVMPVKVNGIEAAKIIPNELNIPVFLSPRTLTITSLKKQKVPGLTVISLK